MKNKTAHQLARELLAGPDLRVIVATRNHTENPADDPQISLGEGYDAIEGGDCEEFLEIHAACEDPGFADSAIAIPAPDKS